MTLRRFLAAVVVVLLPAACATGPQTKENTPERAVEDTYIAFKEALLSGDGAQVAELTTVDSGDFYRDMADEALTAGRGRLAEMGLDQRLVVLTLRHGLSAVQLKRMTGKELLALWVDRGWIWIEEGWIDRDYFADKEPGNYRIMGQAAAARASGYLSWPRQGVAFRYEDGGWRVNFSHSYGPPNKVAEALRAYYRYGDKMTEEEYIFTTLEKATGQKPGPDIWNPPL